MLLARTFGIALTIAMVSVGHADEPNIDYLTQVKPLLTKHCVGCHGAKKQQMGLRVDTARGLFEGGDSGVAVISGDSSKSLLVHAISGTEGASQMPPEGDRLSANEISIVRRWIDDGAKSPADEVAEPSAVKTNDHWAFQPIQHVIPPSVVRMDGLHNGIDTFIRHRLAQELLAPSPEANPETLLRRVHLDLLGLPPTVEVVREFLSDQSPDAFERLVDRLLASPHYGERWGRDWLDAARYADSNGFTRDQPRSIWKYRDWVINALNENRPFDEFAIEQIAGDLLLKPTLEQMVATGFHRNTLINEEGGTDPEQFRVEAVVDRVNTTSTVFLGLTIGCAQCHDHKYDPISQREYYQLYSFFNSTEFQPGDPVAPRIDVPSFEQQQAGEPDRLTAIRGEISRLEAELKDQATTIAVDLAAWEKTLSDDDKKKLPFNVKNAVDLPIVDRSETHKRDLDGYFRGLKVARDKYSQLDEIGRLRESAPKFPSTMVTREIDPPRPTFIHIRGDFLRHGARVEPAVPAVLVTGGANSGTNSPESNSAGANSISQFDSAGRPNRLTLAKWLVSPNNPLTARVIANRYWHRFFGRGLVETENDFGRQGDQPTHPELLDWIASEFRGIENNTAGDRQSSDTNSKTTSSIGSQKLTWDIKRFHRLLVTSATYRQSSISRIDVTEHDPLNRWLARQSRIRVDAEIIRDSALIASGLLADELGGPPVYPPQPDGVFDFTQDKKQWKTSKGGERYRKAMYTHLWRSSLYPSMSIFDFPDPNVTCTRRVRSNTPLQSLTLANDETFFEFARGLANRLLEDPEIDDSQRLSLAYLATVSRVPSSAELNRLRTYLQTQRERFATDPGAAESVAQAPIPQKTSNSEVAAWVAVSRVLMNLDEFITRE